MSCELWVRGTADTGSQIIALDLPVKDWDQTAPLPALIAVGSGSFGRGTYTQYQITGGWQYQQTGWYTIELYLKGDCGATSPEQPCDCINGGCVPKTTYNTPGKYASLALCQAGCAKDSACVGECVSPDQLAALQQAADLVKSKLCG
jgi:hypothetical protein